MHNVITKPGFISPCRRIPHSEDFQVLDCSYFEKTGSEIKIDHHECCVTKLPESQTFFYMISSYDDGNAVQSEYGIGKIYSYGGGRTAFKRENAFRTTDSRGTFYNNNGRPIELNLQADYFVVKTYIPDNYIETLVTPNSVLCSVERFDPTPVELEDNSVLGRLNDKIQSIDGAELRTILTDDRIVDAVKKSKKPLILATNRIELKGKNSRVTCNNLQLQPGPRPSHPTIGFLHYNDGLDCLEVFTSQGWSRVNSTPTG